MRVQVLPSALHITWSLAALAATTRPFGRTEHRLTTFSAESTGAYPVVWLVALPFRLIGISVKGVFALLAGLITLPSRLLNH